MASLEQQLAQLATQLERLQQAIPVDEQVAGLTLELHRPGNGSTYHRLRAPKGLTLANGKRTMSLKAEDVPEWEQKIYARNQQAKVAQCLALVQRAAVIAQGVTWNFSEEIVLVKGFDNFTSGRAKAVAPQAKAQPPQPILKYVFKNAKGASPFNRKVHAISEERPETGRWHSSALCGERPKAGSWGWDTAPDNELSCPQCAAKLKALGID